MLLFKAVRNQEQEIPVNILNDLKPSANIARSSTLLKLSAFSSQRDRYEVEGKNFRTWQYKNFRLIFFRDRYFTNMLHFGVYRSSPPPLSHCWKHLWNSRSLILSSKTYDSALTSRMSSYLRQFKYVFHIIEIFQLIKESYVIFVLNLQVLAHSHLVLIPIIIQQTGYKFRGNSPHVCIS